MGVSRPSAARRLDSVGPTGTPTVSTAYQIRDVVFGALVVEPGVYLDKRDRWDLGLRGVVGYGFRDGGSFVGQILAALSFSP